jgi:hypothetical protein
LNTFTQDANWIHIPKEDRTWLIKHYELAKNNKLTSEDTYNMLLDQSDFHKGILQELENKNRSCESTKEKFIKRVRKDMEETKTFHNFSIFIMNEKQFPFCYKLENSQRLIPIPLKHLTNAYNHYDDI